MTTIIKKSKDKVLNILIRILVLGTWSSILSSCKGLVDIPPPTNTIITETVFRSEQSAESAVNGLYSKLVADRTSSYTFTTAGATSLLGLLSDELQSGNSSDVFMQFYANKLLSDNGQVLNWWTQLYSCIYESNAILENLPNSANISANSKKSFTAQALFFRAFCYYHLISLYGNVPFVTSASNYRQNTIVAKTDESVIRTAIENDLMASIQDLPLNYSTVGNERVKVTQPAAKLLLAKLYLQDKAYAKAEALCSEIIAATDLFDLVPNLNGVFLKNSREAIWQLHIDPKVGTYNATAEGYLFVPTTGSDIPQFFLSQTLLRTFSAVDKRKTDWTGKNISGGIEYIFPYKYKVGLLNSTANGNVTEYYMVFRYAEAFLLRAEANIGQNKISVALSDINRIRNRAGLSDTSAVDQSSAKLILSLESQKEFFCEWGKRWTDLKRMELLNSNMSVETPLKSGEPWAEYKSKLPIPIRELMLNSKLVQNEGY